jgi:hypothetical protein
MVEKSTLLVCFKSDTILISVIIIILALSFVLYLTYVFLKEVKTRIDTKTRTIEHKLSLKEKNQTNNNSNRFLRQTYERPNGVYTGNYNDTIGRKVGYIYNSTTRLPLFENRLNRDYIYFTIDDSRNGNKIFLTTPNKRDPVYDGDTIISDELGGDLTIKKYPIENLTYNANIL